MCSCWPAQMWAWWATRPLGSAAAALRSQPLGHWLIGHLPVLLGEQNVVC